MSQNAENIVSLIKSHRCYSHPIFKHWAASNPEPNVIGALFHQIQMFCSSTRPGWEFPNALEHHGLNVESHLLQEIVESEEGHGPELASMAAHIINKAAGEMVFHDTNDQISVEEKLKDYSNQLLKTLPGYTVEDGLTLQARKAISVFDMRKSNSREDTYRNLGATIALETISHQQLIPGEKLCLVDSGAYGVSLDEPEMHYLHEHWGESGAEAHHEQNAVEAVSSVLNDETVTFIEEGAQDFLDSLCALWDVLDSTLLHSGIPLDKDVKQVA